jgi:hypothetical protein
VHRSPIPLLGLLAAATLGANLVVLDEAVTTAAVEVTAVERTADGAARDRDDVEGRVRELLPTAATVRADAARLQVRADAWLHTPPAVGPARDAEADAEAAAEGVTAAEAEPAGPGEAPARADGAAARPTTPEAPAAAPDPPTPAAGSAPEPTPTPTPTPTPAPAPAGPAPVADDQADCDHRCRGERLHQQLRVHEPPRWSVVFEGEHPAYLGLADSRTRTITIYLRASLPDRVLLWTLYHEVGHSHDFTFLNTAERDRWSAARGYAGATWFGCNGCSDYETPAGDWAEAFASCHTGWDDQWRSELGAPPTPAQCELLHELRQP